MAYGTLLALMMYQLATAVAKSVSPDPWSPGALTLSMWAVVAVAAVPLVLPVGTGGLRSVQASVDGPPSTAWQTPPCTSTPPLDEEYRRDHFLRYFLAGSHRYCLAGSHMYCLGGSHMYCLAGSHLYCLL